MQVWVKERELPQSQRGHHTKVESLLDDPTVAAKLKAYLHSNKWSMNPDKVLKISKDKLIPSAANKYLCKIVCDEIPCGLKHCMELELFLQIHLKVGKGISLTTA